jgi:hypothetical protein
MFYRIGYYVRHEYEDPEMQENPPEQPIFDKLIRHILDTSPRVTKFKIAWEDQVPDQTPSVGGDAKNPETLLEGLSIDSPMKAEVVATGDNSLDVEFH